MYRDSGEGPTAWMQEVGQRMERLPGNPRLMGTDLKSVPKVDK